MNNTVIRKVRVLQGVAKEIAEDYGLEPNDLVILSVSLEKVIGSPVEYLLSKLNGAEFSNPTWSVIAGLRPPETTTRDEEVDKAWIELCSSTSSPFWPSYEEFKKGYQSSDTTTRRDSK